MLLQAALFFFFTAASSKLTTRCDSAALCDSMRANVTNFVQAFYDVMVYGNQGPYLPGGPAYPAYIYKPGAAVACISEVESQARVCLMISSNAPNSGTPASTIISKLAALYHHGCQRCGRTPLNDLDNDTTNSGFLAVTWLGWDNGCQGLCNSLRAGSANQPYNRSMNIITSQLAVPDSQPQTSTQN